jgi:anthranilate synthase component 2
MKILIIDNYDSFTYNLYQYVGELLLSKNDPFIVDVIRNDEITVDEIKQKNYDKIIISPGPGDPRDLRYFGVCGEVIMRFGKDIPILGICLGMQGIACVFGGSVEKAQHPMHGKTSKITHDEKGVFIGLPQKIEVMRYHSLIVSREDLPSCFTITSFVPQTEEIMGIRHTEYPIEGIQFHPESFATEYGKEMIHNFLFHIYEK